MFVGSFVRSFVRSFVVCLFVCLFVFCPCVRLFVRSFVCLFVVDFCLAEIPCGNCYGARDKKTLFMRRRAERAKRLVGKTQRAPGSNRSSDLSAGGHRRQDASFGGPKSHLEGHIPAPKVPGSKNPAPNNPKRPGCARSREMGGRVHS